MRPTEHGTAKVAPRPPRTVLRNYPLVEELPVESETAVVVVVGGEVGKKRKKGKGTFLGMRLGRLFGRGKGGKGEEGVDVDSNDAVDGVT